jgi:hypothetical protein
MDMRALQRRDPEEVLPCRVSGPDAPDVFPTSVHRLHSNCQHVAHVLRSSVCSLGFAAGANGNKQRCKSSALMYEQRALGRALVGVSVEAVCLVGEFVHSAVPARSSGMSVTTLVMLWPHLREVAHTLQRHSFMWTVR